MLGVYVENTKRMTDTTTTLQAVIDQPLAADLNPIKDFLFSNPSEPLIAIGSGGAETAGEFAALLYGARGGVATSVSPYTLNSFSDAALKTAKVLLISKGGHNNDIVFATRRALEVNPESPKNPGRIDKRKPMWVPFMAALRKQGALCL